MISSLIFRIYFATPGHRKRMEFSRGLFVWLQLCVGCVVFLASSPRRRRRIGGPRRLRQRRPPLRRKDADDARAAAG